MGFIDNIKQCVWLDAEPLNPCFRAVVFGESAVYVEGVKCILSFVKEEIVLGLKNGCLKVKGQGLYVKKYCLGDIVICGKICTLERC